jgi:hypothetical protein
MPVHDWSLVTAGTFHDFHNAWIIHLKEVMNSGLLPPGYYAQSEQHTSLGIADILTLQRVTSPPPAPPPTGSLAVAEAPPKVRRRVAFTPEAAARALRRTLAVRHVSTHRVVALVEIVSPANKDRPRHVADLVGKIADALTRGVNVTLIDLFPPGPHDPLGLHCAVCEEFDVSDEPPPPDQPLILASYCADRFPVAYLEPLAVGGVLPDMPLFLDPDRYVNVPLEATYQAAYRGMPAFWRDVLEGRESPPG